MPIHYSNYKQRSMNRINRRPRRVTALLVLFLTMFWLGQHFGNALACTFDYSGSTATAATTTIGQYFTAPCTGTITKIEFLAAQNEIGLPNGILTIHDDKLVGTARYTQSNIVGTGGWVTVTLSTPFPVTLNSRYTFIISSNQNIDIFFSTPSLMLNGEIYLSGSFDDTKTMTFKMTITEAAAPTITTTAATSVTTSTATSGGNVTSDGGATVTARGVCWNTSGTPTITDSKTSDGTGAGAFTSSLTGLSASTTYYARAYATNSVGTSYGSQVSLTTSAASSASLDILWRNSQSGKNVVWLMSGANYSNFSNLPDSPIVWTIGGVADFDKDGKSDILWRNTSDTRNCIWYMNGATRREFVFLENAALPWAAIGAADFDLNGSVDILWRNPSSGKNILWLPGYPHMFNAWLPDASSAWTAEGVGDIDADGKIDILWRNHGNNKFYIWLMDGVTLKQAVAMQDVPSAWYIRGVADFNNDGKNDILWRNTQTGKNYIWYMNGTTRTSAVEIQSYTSATGWDIYGVGTFH